jgi:hypothetical protein
MKLFELNARLAVKLGQELNTLYDLDYMEYSMYVNIINKEIEEANEKIKEAENLNLKVNLPTGLRI